MQLKRRACFVQVRLELQRCGLGLHLGCVKPCEHPTPLANFFGQTRISATAARLPSMATLNLRCRGPSGQVTLSGESTDPHEKG